MTFHKDSFGPTEAYSPLSYKDDPFLSKKNIAKITARFQNLARTGSAPKTIEQTIKDAERSLKDRLPNISALFATLPNWDVQGPARESKTLQDKFFAEYKAYNLPDVEARYRANVRTIKELNKRRDDVNSAFIRVVEKTSLNEIIIYMDADASDAAGGYVPKATTSDVIAAVNGIKTAGKGGLYKKAVKINLLAENSNIPSVVRSQVTPGTVAFTYNGSDQIFAYVERIKDESQNLTRPDNWWSNDIVDLNSAYAHIIPHEVGHLIEHEIYGNAPGQASVTLSSDMAKYASGDYEPTESDDGAPVVATDSLDRTPLPSTTDASKVLADKNNPKDLSSWDVGSRLGSNPGGVTTDPATGEQVYMKVPSDEIHAQNEVLASAFYQALGLRTADTKFGTRKGAPVIFSEIIPGAVSGIDRSDPAFIQQLQKGYAVDAFLANWDSLANPDNIMKDTDGSPIWIDPGGALLFRAQGGAKGSAFSDDVKELDTLVDPKHSSSASIYGAMTPQQKVDSAKIIQQLKPEDIDILVNGIVTDPATAKFLRETLRKRREYILKRFNLSLDPAADAEAKKAADLSKTQGTKLKGKGSKSGKPEAISGRGSEDDSENFAELFSLYANTGEAPQWFVELLKSKGYEKRKISKLWRQALSAEKKRLLDLVDKAEAEESIVTPEKQMSSNNGFTYDYGPIHAHTLARWNGVASNKPEVVDSFPAGTKVLYRGVKGNPGKSEKQMYEEFIDSDIPFYSNTTMWGDGLYSSNDRSTGMMYGSGNSYGVWEMALKPGAKVYVYDQSASIRSGGKISSNLLDPSEIDNNGINIDELRRTFADILAEKVQNEMFPELTVTDPQVMSEVNRLMSLMPTGRQGNNSNWAALMGYDAIEIVHNLGGESYFVFFNRGMLQIKRK